MNTYMSDNWRVHYALLVYTFCDISVEILRSVCAHGRIVFGSVSLELRECLP